MIRRLLNFLRPKPDNTGNGRTVIDYEKVELLDAEDLAELGIGQAYLGLSQKLRDFGVDPEAIEEVIDVDGGCYSVRCGEKLYEICGGKDEEWEKDSWGRASYVLFNIVNSQLMNSEVKFYALNGGNDLAGVFLTTTQFNEARDNLRDKNSWPYLPVEEGPWFGMPHQ